MIHNMIHRIPQQMLMLAGFVLMLGSAATSHAQNFEGKKISSVGVRYNGPRTVDEAKLRGHMSVRAGQNYSASRLDEDVRSLYESGLVDDVRFFAEPRGAGVKVTAEVTTRAKIIAIGFVGNTRFSDKKLAGVTQLKAGGVMSDQAILSARRNVLDHYRGFGYADVNVGHRIQTAAAAGTAELVLIVDEGARAEVRKIRFEGNSSYPSHVLRNEMKTKQKGWFSFFTKSGRIDNIKLDEDLDRVLDYYRNRGYLRVSATVGKAPLEDGRVDLVITVNEGDKYVVAGVGFGTMKVFQASELVPALTLVAGDGYSAKKMYNDIRTIRSYYGSRGYSDAAVSPDIRNVSATSVNIIYRVAEGRRYQVGRVTIEGNDKTQDRVIRRELPMKPGDFLNSIEMDTTRRRLQNMNYFNNVQVSAAPSVQSGYRDINITVNEKKTGSISFGLGFSSVDSIVGYVNLEQTNFDITNWGSFTGAGQRFSSKVQMGSERKDFSMSWVEPWFLGQRLALGAEIFYRDALYYSSEYEQSQYGMAWSLRKPVSKRAYVRGEYRIEDIGIDVDSNTPPASAFWAEDGDFIRSAISVNYVYDSRDSNQLPRKGHKLDFGLTYAGGMIGGDVDVYIASGTGSKYWNLWGDSILSVKGNVTVADTHGSNKMVPIFDRQMLGGPHSLRGFENRDAGPRDPLTGESLGGNSSAFASVEYTFPLIERVRGAVFYDVGTVNAKSWDFGGGLYHDAGFGLRLNLPFGPLAIDYAIPMGTPSTDKAADQGGQFQFYLDYKF
ncbi:MAG: outer membrane protein assembly factor BamA [Verrucomicrobiae bacterium]|nr:outer membrane protein assembly factor BamA [Verrucomicrobiae bacterium]NNJ42587.1 outer membrane protein assembly factor BamA [Akkermansiaceae bacterium]